MKNILTAVAAGLLSLNIISPAPAAAGALDGLGSFQSVDVPKAPSRAATVVSREQAPHLDFSSYFGHAEFPRTAELVMQKGLKGLPETVISVDLEAIRNAYLKTSLTFTAASGTKVHISGLKAANCPSGAVSCEDSEKFFLLLTTDRGETFFVRAMSILNYGMFYSGSKAITIAGETYVAKLYGDATSPGNSRLEIKGPEGMALTATLKQIGDAAAKAGTMVKLSHAYKLAYSNEIVQGLQGAKFTSKMLVILMPYPVVDASAYYVLNASEIKPTGNVFPSFESDYGFKIQSGKLEIYKI